MLVVIKKRIKNYSTLHRYGNTLRRYIVTDAIIDFFFLYRYQLNTNSPHYKPEKSTSFTYVFFFS